MRGLQSEHQQITQNTLPSLHARRVHTRRDGARPCVLAAILSVLIRPIRDSVRPSPSAPVCRILLRLSMRGQLLPVADAAGAHVRGGKRTR
jgi:hypothetical protein